MKCKSCGFLNKQDTETCKKCGSRLFKDPIWKPNLIWHIKVLAIIYLFLIILFFTLNHFLKPYMRQVPQDITPWLKTK